MAVMDAAFLPSFTFSSSRLFVDGPRDAPL